MGKQEDIEWYKRKIIEIVEKIENLECLKMIYGMSISSCAEIKSRGD